VISEIQAIALIQDACEGMAKGFESNPDQELTARQVAFMLRDFKEKLPVELVKALR
jgi:hypothetical protein